MPRGNKPAAETRSDVQQKRIQILIKDLKLFHYLTEQAENDLNRRRNTESGQYVKCHNAGMTSAEIAKAVGKTPDAINKAIRQQRER
jgi:hypothetical protein